MSKHCMPVELPIGKDYVYKNTLGTKFFIVKKCLQAQTPQTKHHENKSTFEMSDLLKSAITIKQTTIFEEIYFVDYDSHTDTLTYVYANDINSGCYDTRVGLAIDLIKIPKTVINGNMFTSIRNDENLILTLEELFVYKDILQP